MKLKIILAVLALVFLVGAVYSFVQLKNKQSENQELRNRLDQAVAESLRVQSNDQAQPTDSQATNSPAAAPSLNQKNGTTQFPSDIVSKNKSDYKTVKLANGEIYYGIITNYSAGVVTLNDIFYTQGFVNFSDTTANQSQISLVKRGQELDGAKDPMLIKDSSIVSIETLSQSSKVWQAIEEYNKHPAN